MSINQEQFNAIVTVLTALPGFQIDLFSRLTLCPLENGQFAVWLYDDDCKNIEYEMIFVDPYKAAEHFLEIRERYQLGFDFEGKRDSVTHEQ